MRLVTTTLLVFSSPFQKSGTVKVCLSTDVFGGGAFLGAFSFSGSFAATNTSYSPAATVNDRLTRNGAAPGVTGTYVRSSYAYCAGFLSLSSFFAPAGGGATAA